MSTPLLKAGYGVLWATDSTTGAPDQVESTAGAAHVDIKDSIGYDSLTDAAVSRDLGDYGAVAGGSSNQIMGTTGAVGDFITRIVAVGTAAGQTVTVLDDTTSLLALDVGDETKTFEIGWASKNGAWKITTSANVSCVVSGSFT